LQLTIAITFATSIAIAITVVLSSPARYAVVAAGQVTSKSMSVLLVNGAINSQPVATTILRRQVQAGSHGDHSKTVPLPRVYLTSFVHYVRLGIMLN
jgi:hypothetical protein